MNNNETIINPIKIEPVLTENPFQEDVPMAEVLFAAAFANDEKTTQRRQELIVTFKNTRVFRDEFYVFFLLISNFPKINFNEDFIRLYLQTHKAVFAKSTNINLAKYRLVKGASDNTDDSNVDEVDEYTQFVISCIDYFEQLQGIKVRDEDFYRQLEMVKMDYMFRESIKILEESVIILTEGAKIGSKKLVGYNDMRAHLAKGFHELDNIVKKKDRKGIITYGSNDEEEESDKLQLITTFGIEELDNSMGGVYEGDMVSILAPAKGGKSRFSTFILHNAVVKHGTSIVMWSIENGYKGWEALIRARHFDYFYNRGLLDVTVKRIIDSDMIRKGELPPELEELELASWTDLRCNQNYGKITSIDDDFDADTFLDVLDAAVNSTGAKLVCIDYLQLISDSGNRNGRYIPKNERIGEAYKKTLQYLKKKKIGGIFPAQLKQTVVGDLSTIDPDELINKELRDAAGESYEVIKTPDINLALYGTVEDIRNGYMKILSIPSRNSAPFQPVDIYCDLGSCTFSSIRFPNL